MLIIVTNITSFCWAEDWPQWNGPRRDGTVRERGLLETIPAEGLKVAWRQPVSSGYSGPMIADGKLFVFDYTKTTGDITNNAGKRDEPTGKERLLCFDESTGKPLWTYEYDRPYAVSYGAGPRATPSFHEGFVYALGAESPEGYRETGRFPAITPTSKTMGRTVVWTFPAIANCKLFVRNDLEVVCSTLKAGKQ